MTLEQLITYLWREMPLVWWGCIVAAACVVAGVAIALEGRGIMQSSSSRSQMQAIATDGSVVQTETSSIGPDYWYGRKIARNGLVIAGFALVGFFSLLQLW